MTSKFFKRLIILVLMVLSGIIGGLSTYALIGYLPNHNIISQTTTTTNSSESKVTINQTEVKTATTEAVKTIQDAVVSVVNYQTQVSQEDLYSRIFGNSSATTQSGELAVYSEGSGAIYKKDGKFAYVVTNNHVVEGAEKLEIILSNGTRLEGELVGADTYSDLAVIKISSDTIQTVAQFADSSTLTLGEPAIAIGSPLGSEYANSVTEGIISGLSRTVTSTNNQGQTVSINAIQTDAAINQGNSGGPLVNIKGQIIGINSVKITSSRTNVAVEGMGFAIPSNDVVSIISQLETNGQVIRPVIGITMANLTDVAANLYGQLNLPNDVTSGIVVASAQEGMPAEGKLEPYDVITAINDEPIHSISDLQSVLYKNKLGDTITVTFYRKNEKKTVNITLTKTTQDLSSTQ
ncbi:S1C family serine protease [Streptococcus entericus]|uniref:S1C family serine protease n=1 Tax=Streptococcus entericus TaxID=155680 RepID=UPI00035EAB6F|nr:trypsin-like peptidase domain-containing protein [Streptococcus entericus]